LEKQAESSQTTGLTKNAKRLQKYKHILTCNSEAIQELQLISIEKQDKKEEEETTRISRLKT
jgi:hypothetical protein